MWALAHLPTLNEASTAELAAANRSAKDRPVSSATVQRQITGTLKDIVANLAPDKLDRKQWSSSNCEN